MLLVIGGSTSLDRSFADFRHYDFLRFRVYTWCISAKSHDLDFTIRYYFLIKNSREALRHHVGFSVLKIWLLNYCHIPYRAQAWCCLPRRLTSSPHLSLSASIAQAHILEPVVKSLRLKVACHSISNKTSWTFLASQVPKNAITVVIKFYNFN